MEFLAIAEDIRSSLNESISSHNAMDGFDLSLFIKENTKTESELKSQSSIKVFKLEKVKNVPWSDYSYKDIFERLEIEYLHNFSLLETFVVSYGPLAAYCYFLVRFCAHDIDDNLRTKIISILSSNVEPHSLIDIYEKMINDIPLLRIFSDTELLSMKQGARANMLTNFSDVYAFIDQQSKALMILRY